MVADEHSENEMRVYRLASTGCFQPSRPHGSDLRSPLWLACVHAMRKRTTVPTVLGTFNVPLASVA